MCLKVDLELPKQQGSEPGLRGARVRVQGSKAPASTATSEQEEWRGQAGVLSGSPWGWRDSPRLRELLAVRLAAV